MEELNKIALSQIEQLEKVQKEMPITWADKQVLISEQISKWSLFIYYIDFVERNYKNR